MDNFSPYKHPSLEQLLEIFPEGIEIIKTNQMLRVGEIEMEKILPNPAEEIALKKKILKELRTLYTEEEPVRKAALEHCAERIYSESADHIDKPLSVYVASLLIYENYLKDIKKEIQKLKTEIAMWDFSHGTHERLTGQLTSDKIIAAKQIPFESLTKIFPGGFIKCPFHEEKTPSCKIYKVKNNFHCFGCGAHGDIIDFVMKLHALEFGDAVRYLVK